MQKLILTLCAVLAAVCSVQAETLTLDPVVVTATRTATPLSQVGSSVTVVTAEEIEEKGQTKVIDVLRSVPGLNITQTGGMGASVAIYQRGTDTKHTLVLIDGIEFRDASSTGGGANLANISTDNVERIEIVRGAQSVIYGSDAIGGVINIITQKGSSEPHGYASIERGAYQTTQTTAGISGGSDNTHASFSYSHIDSQGFSSYNEKDGFTEDDGYKNTNFSLNVGVDFSKTFTMNMNFRLADSEYEFDSGYYDAFWNYTMADTDAVTDSLEIAGRTEGVWSLLDGKWTIVLGASATDSNHTTTGTYDNYEYNGRVTKLDLQNTIKLNDRHTFLVGLETEKEQYDTSFGDDGDVNNKAAFIQDQIFIDDFAVALGIRLDNHEEFGTETTWRIAPAYTVPGSGTKLKASFATGFKAPSLYQLYSYYGNTDLDPETSTSVDFGIEQAFFDSSLIVAVTVFHNDIDDYIGYSFVTSQYYNIAELTTKGVETSVDFYPCDFADLKLGYTYTDSEDGDGVRKARIPLHKATFDVNLYPIDEVLLNVGILYLGERYDGSYSDETLGGYTLVNLSASWQFVENLKITARVDNLFDKQYEEVAGYGTAGASAYLGLKASF